MLRNGGAQRAACRMLHDGEASIGAPATGGAALSSGLPSVDISERGGALGVSARSVCRRDCGARTGSADAEAALLASDRPSGVEGRELAQKPSAGVDASGRSSDASPNSASSERAREADRAMDASGVRVCAVSL